MLRSDASAAPAQVGPDDTCVSKQFASSPVPSGLDPAKTDCVVVKSVALTSNDNSASEVLPSYTELPTLSGVPTTLKNPENSEEKSTDVSQGNVPVSENEISVTVSSAGTEAVEIAELQPISAQLSVSAPLLETSDPGEKILTIPGIHRNFDRIEAIIASIEETTTAVAQQEPLPSESETESEAEISAADRIAFKIVQRIESAPPSKSFSRKDNIAITALNEFRQALPCPKCNDIHQHNKHSSSQYRGGPLKCNNSHQQLLMALPDTVSKAVIKHYKSVSVHEANNAIAWLSSSKAADKQALLASLKASLSRKMALDTPSSPASTDLPATTSQEAQTSVPAQRPITDIEADFAIVDEFMIAKRRINQLEAEKAQLQLRLEAVQHSLCISLKENGKLKETCEDQGRDLITLRKDLEAAKHALHNLQSTQPTAPPTSQATPTRPAAAPSFATATATAPTQVFQTVNYKRQRDSASTSAPKSAPPPRERKPIDYSIFTAPSTPISRPSKLRFIYFKGLYRAPPSTYRDMFTEIGIESAKIRDILFLAENLVQFLTFDDCVDPIVKALGEKFPSAEYLPDADPCDPLLYVQVGSFSREHLTKAYFEAMEGMTRRFRAEVGQKPGLTRTLHFLEKVLESRNHKYGLEPQAAPKALLMNRFVSPMLTETVTSSPDAEMPAADTGPMEVSL